MNTNNQKVSRSSYKMASNNVDMQGLSIISCQQCRQRKIKCGRQFPKCQNCTKKDWDCSYPETHRRTSTRLKKKHKYGNARFYGFSSVNRSLFEVGMPFCNVDFELEGKNARCQIRRFTTSPVFKKYIGNSNQIDSALKSMCDSISCSFFDNVVEINLLRLSLRSKQGVDYQVLLLAYSTLIVSERFISNYPAVQEIIAELTLLIDQCPDCPEKVSSLILLADYYHFNLKLEAAWKCIFQATSIGYALGLHSTSSKVWTMLVLQDALLCSVLGRPSSISSVNSKLICRLCDGWGEIAITIRDCNDILLNLKSSDCLEKAISLDMKCDDLIERMKKTIKDEAGNDDTSPMLLEYLKICIVASNRIKLLFPFFSRHRAVKAQLDENCSSLAIYLKLLFQFLCSSGLATEESKFSLRSHFFPAYCTTFQGFLLLFLFISDELLRNHNPNSMEVNSNFFSGEPGRGNLLLSSLENTKSLLKEFDQVLGRIHFCNFMNDLFASFRSLLDQKPIADRKIISEQNTSSETSTEKLLNVSSMNNELNNDSPDRSQHLFMEDIADWIYTCFSDGKTHYCPTGQPS